LFFVFEFFVSFFNSLPLLVIFHLVDPNRATVRLSRKKVYLRTIEMKICVFRTNTEHNKSTGKTFSHQFCFIFNFFLFLFLLVVFIISWNAGEQDKTLIVCEFLFWFSLLFSPRKKKCTLNARISVSHSACAKVSFVCLTSMLPW
jgi:hypothetical protein